MAFATLRFKNLWVPITLHTVNNLTAISIALINESNSSAIASLNDVRSVLWPGVTLTLIGLPFLIVVLKRGFSSLNE